MNWESGLTTFPLTFIPLAFSLCCAMFTLLQNSLPTRHFFLPQILPGIAQPASPEGKFRLDALDTQNQSSATPPATAATEQLARVQEFSRQDGE